MSAESYLQEIRSVDSELKRLTARTKELRAQKRRAQTNLHSYMVRHDMERVGSDKHGVSLKQCAPPKQRQKAKPKKARREDTIELLRCAGIPDPQTLYEQIEASQKLADPTAVEAGPQLHNPFDF